MLPLSTDCLALRPAAVGLFEPLGHAFLGGRLPLSLSLRRTTAGAFSGNRAVLGTKIVTFPGDFAFLVLFFDTIFITRHVFGFRRSDGIKVVGEYNFRPSVVSSIRENNHSHRRASYRRPYMLGLSTILLSEARWNTSTNNYSSSSSL